MPSLSQKWQEYRPSKGVWAWSCIGCIVLTMIVGFTLGGWVTGGTAERMKTEAAEQARETLVATLCVNKFVASPNAAITLAKLKETSTWERDDFIEEGGWATVEGLDEQVSGAADLCAERLAAMDDLPATAAEPASSDSADNQG